MSKGIGVLSALIYVGFSAYELIHDAIQREAWTGYTPYANWAVVILVPLWLIAAGALVFYGRRQLNWAWVVPGILAFLVHGVILAIGTSRMGYVMLIAAVVQAFLLATYLRARHRPALWIPGEEQEPGQAA